MNKIKSTAVIKLIMARQLYLEHNQDAIRRNPAVNWAFGIVIKAESLEGAIIDINDFLVDRAFNILVEDCDASLISRVLQFIELRDEALIHYNSLKQYEAGAFHVIEERDTIRDNLLRVLNIVDYCDGRYQLAIEMAQKALSLSSAFIHYYRKERAAIKSIGRAYLVAEPNYADVKDDMIRQFTELFDECHRNCGLNDVSKFTLMIIGEYDNTNKNIPDVDETVNVKCYRPATSE